MMAAAHSTERLAPVSHTEQGRLVLKLWSLNTHARCEITSERDDGGFDDAARAEFSKVLIDPRHRSTHEIEPRLIDLVYQLATHFNAQRVAVVSGYREGNESSNHGHGRAVDLFIPGVSDREVSDWAIANFQHVGVGYYPNDHFVHLDVRDRSFTWVDTSGPEGPRHHARHHSSHHRHHHH